MTQITSQMLGAAFLEPGVHYYATFHCMQVNIRSECLATFDVISIVARF